jgi:hypothetical protein
VQAPDLNWLEKPRNGRHGGVDLLTASPVLGDIELYYEHKIFGNCEFAMASYVEKMPTVLRWPVEQQDLYACRSSYRLCNGKFCNPK